MDRAQRQKLRHANLTEAQLNAEADKSPGVLLSSGYIAGGAIAGILIAFMGGILTDLTNAIDAWSAANNPFYSEETWNGLRSDALSLIPFVVLIVFLYLVGREKLLKDTPAND